MHLILAHDQTGDLMSSKHYFGMDGRKKGSSFLLLIVMEAPASCVCSNGMYTFCNDARGWIGAKSSEESIFQFTSVLRNLANGGH